MSVDNGPERISRYEIQGLIARGGMGRVYLARDPNTGRLVVVKLLDATLDTSDVRDRFDREAKSLASLSHPNIVHIYDYGDFQDSPFIVMEYVRGETVEEKIKRRARMPVTDKLRLLSELAAGLAHAHAAGIIHRDVKPANLMVDHDERLKILDFGIARVTDSNLTRAHTLAKFGQVQIGSPGYMSPEQTRGDEIDPRTDIFSVGAVAYELLSYREAFPGSTRAEIESRVMRTPPESLTTVVPDLDPEIAAIVSKCLAADPAGRYQDANALGLALEGCLSRLAPGVSATSTTASASPPPPATAGPSPARADAAYGRALAAYEAKSFDIARRLTLEALAEQPDHGGARALMARLKPPPAQSQPARPPVPAPPPQPQAARRSAMSDQRRDGPQTVSIDPTVLIDRASLQKPPDQVDPTIAVQRDEVLRRRPDPAPYEPPPVAPRQPPRPVSEPTILVEPNRRPSAPPPRTAKTKPSFLAGLLPSWSTLKGGNRPSSAPPPHRRSQAKRGAAANQGFWTSTTRGAAIAIAVVAAASFFVLGAIAMTRWLMPGGHALTLTPPTGGTLIGPGLRCGSDGNDCSTTVANDEMVEIRAQADPDYVFAGFTGDCAPAGRMAMTEPRTCAATFHKVGDGPVGPGTPGPQFALTIEKPTGGTIVAIGDILCGSLGDNCSTNLPNGERVQLRYQTEPGHRFVSYTGDCAPTGETTMIAARVCGATFAPTGGGRITAQGRPEAPPPTTTPRPKPRPQGETASSGAEGGTSSGQPGSQGAASPPAAGAGAAQQPGTGAGPTQPAAPPPTAVQGKPAEAPITAEDHAKKEIAQLLKQYCLFLETRDADKVRTIFPLADRNTLRNQFREYKSLKCTVGEPKFDRLDASPAGGAQVQVEMKQVIEMQSGGAPKVSETIATIVISRRDLRNPWLIDRVHHDAKPKP